MRIFGALRANYNIDAVEIIHYSSFTIHLIKYAGVAELADAYDSGNLS